MKSLGKRVYTLNVYLKWLNSMAMPIATVYARNMSIVSGYACTDIHHYGRIERKRDGSLGGGELGWSETYFP